MDLPLYIVELIEWNNLEHEKIRSRIYSGDEVESRRAARDLVRQMVNYSNYMECLGYRLLESFSQGHGVDEDIIPYDDWKTEMYKNIPEHIRKTYENTRCYKRV